MQNSNECETTANDQQISASTAAQTKQSDSGNTREVSRREAKKMISNAMRDAKILEEGLARIFS